MSALWSGLSGGTRFLGGSAIVLALLGAALAASGESLSAHLGFAAVVKIWGGALLVQLGLVGLGRILRLGGGSFAVARVLIAETVRRRVAWICATLLLVGLAAIPYLVRSNSVLEYRLSSFLGYSLFVTFFLLAILTVFGASGSLCEEIADRRIHSVVVKPIGRVRFLFGKWLGLVLLNVLLLMVSGAVTLGSFHWELAVAEGDEAEVARVDHLLTTHHSVQPDRPEGLLEDVIERSAVRRSRDPELWQAMLSAEGGDEDQALIHLQRELYIESLAQWRNVRSGETRTYRFRVAGQAAQQAGSAPARLLLAPFFGRVHSTDRTRLLVRLDGVETPVFLGGGESTELSVPANALADGELVVEIENPGGTQSGAHSANLVGRDRLSLEVQRGSLTGNLARALAILAIQLAFIAAVGLAAGTFLGLPVAVLLVSLVLFAAAGGGFFSGDIAQNPLPSHLSEHDHSHGDGQGHDHSIGATSGFMRALDGVGRSFIQIFSAWGRYSPIDAVSSGTEIPPRDLLGCLLWIGGAWTGIVACVGALIFRRREIARVQV